MSWLSASSNASHPLRTPTDRRQEGEERIAAARALTRTLLDPSRAAADLLDVLMDALDATRGSLLLLNPRTGRLRVTAARGLPAAVIGQDLRPKHRRISDWVCREGNALVLNGPVKDDRFDGTGANEEIQSAMSLPLPGVRGTIGVVNLTRLGTPALFDDADLALAHELVRGVGGVVDRLRGLECAAASWQSLEDLLRGPGIVPATTSTWRHRIAVVHVGSEVLGADLFESVAHSDGSVTVMLADVTGSGAAALRAASLVRGLFLASARHTRSPAELARTLSADVYRALGDGACVGAWLAHLSGSGGVTSCNAGLPEPVCVPLEGDPGWLAVGGPLLGVAAEGRYEQQTCPLLPGDTIVAVTDGVLQTANAGAIEFGRERFDELALEMRRLAPERIAMKIGSEALEFSGLSTPVDDALAVAIRYSRED